MHNNPNAQKGKFVWQHVKSGFTSHRRYAPVLHKYCSTSHVPPMGTQQTLPQAHGGKQHMENLRKGQTISNFETIHRLPCLSLEHLKRAFGYLWWSPVHQSVSICNVKAEILPRISFLVNNLFTYYHKKTLLLFLLQLRNPETQLTPLGWTEIELKHFCLYG